MSFEPWNICLLTDHGTLKVLDCFDTYQQADQQLDKWEDHYHFGIVDIYSRGFLLNAEVEQ
jgi:hypothetical protein